MPRTTKYTWFIHGHVPVTFDSQDAKALFEGVWQSSFTQAGFPAAEAANVFNVNASSDGNGPATHIYFATPLTQPQFWYIGEAMATMIGEMFPVEDGDTPDEIIANPDVATFLSTLAGLGVYATIGRNDLGQNRINHVSYLAEHSLQPISS